MIQSIYAGVSGLQSFQTGIDVLANNIANVNTVGFRGSSTEFSNLFEQAVNATSNPISNQSGLGVKVGAISLDLKTGSYLQTENQTDLAIIGNDGWFGLSGQGDSFYTRAGSFHFDVYNPDGAQESPFFPVDETSIENTDLRLVSQDGFFVTGTLGNNTNNGVLEPVLGNLDLGDVTEQEALVFPSKLTYPNEPSTEATFFGNLGLEDTVRSASATVISPENERNNLRLIFTKSAVQPTLGSSWDIVATTGTADSSTIYDTQTGSVQFGEFGELVSSNLPPLNNNGALVTANLGDRFSGLIAHDGPSTVASSTTDGTLGGELLKYTVNRNGEVLGNFDNGRTSVVGKVAIYHFQNDQGLEQVGSNKFRQSLNSGNPIFYAQDNGNVLNNTLENSNVSLETALTELIIMQRSYDATSKTISTADQLLQNALQMGS